MKRALPCGRPLPPKHAAPTPARLLEWQSRLRAYLSSKRLKFTEPRWTIARLILETGGHLDAQELLARVKRRSPGIGAATVYRSIKVLCEAGLLEASHQDTRGRILYELPDDHHHDHIICLDCGHVFEFHDEKIETLQERAANANGFRLEGHRHVIHGHCEFLRKKV